MPAKHIENLLLCHSFSGCDTVSSIYGFGKVNILKKMCHDKAPSEAINKLKGLRALKEDIADAGVRLFQYLYGQQDVPLNQQRYEKYNKLMVKGTFKPEKLPPTSEGAAQHALRSYLQYHDWILLQSQSLDPTEYGWTYNGVSFEPIGSLAEIAPESLIKFISCNCNIDTNGPSCNNYRCTCRKYGLKCIPACGNCHGLECENSKTNATEQDSDEDEYSEGV